MLSAGPAYRSNGQTIEKQLGLLLENDSWVHSPLRRTIKAGPVDRRLSLGHELERLKLLIFLENRDFRTALYLRRYNAVQLSAFLRFP
jgi:hypothetical protein